MQEQQELAHCVQRLSQRAREPVRHWKRQWYCSDATTAARWSSSGADSSSVPDRTTPHHKPLSESLRQSFSAAELRCQSSFLHRQRLELLFARLDGDAQPSKDRLWMASTYSASSPVSGLCNRFHL